MIRNEETGEIHIWTIPRILKEINRDRSAEWSNYNKRDWREGLSEFTEFKLIKKMKKVI